MLLIKCILSAFVSSKPLVNKLIKYNEAGAASIHKNQLSVALNYSSSIVPGGFDVISYTTLLIPLTEFTILFDIFCKNKG